MDNTADLFEAAVFSAMTLIVDQAAATDALLAELAPVDSEDVVGRAG
jgi:hypothetical protein